MLRNLVAHKNPQPTIGPSTELIVTPGRIGLTKQTTFVKEPGEVTIVNANMPGVRKHVIAFAGNVKIVGDNVEGTVELKGERDFCLLEWTGYKWKTLYSVERKSK